MDQWKLKRLFNEATAEITRLRAELRAMREALEKISRSPSYASDIADAALATSPAEREE